jgi:hypothetical protein
MPRGSLSLRAQRSNPHHVAPTGDRRVAALLAMTGIHPLSSPGNGITRPPSQVLDRLPALDQRAAARRGLNWSGQVTSATVGCSSIRAAMR